MLFGGSIEGEPYEFQNQFIEGERYRLRVLKRPVDDVDAEPNSVMQPIETFEWVTFICECVGGRVVIEHADGQVEELRSPARLVKE